MYAAGETGTLAHIVGSCSGLASHLAAFKGYPPTGNAMNDN